MRKPPKGVDVITDRELHEVAQLQHALFNAQKAVHQRTSELIARVEAGARVESIRYYVDLTFGGVRSRRQQWGVLPGGKAATNE